MKREFKVRLALFSEEQCADYVSCLEEIDVEAYSQFGYVFSEPPNPNEVYVLRGEIPNGKA